MINNKFVIIVQVSSVQGSSEIPFPFIFNHVLPPFPGYGFIPGLCFSNSGISISRACLTL